MCASGDSPHDPAPGLNAGNELVSAFGADHSAFVLDDAFTTEVLRAGNAAGDCFPFGMMQTALQRECAHGPGGGAEDDSAGGVSGAGAGDSPTGASRLNCTCCPVAIRFRTSSGGRLPWAAATRARICASALLVFLTRRNEGNSSICT